MYNFQISEVLDHAWALTKKHGLILALILFGVTFVPNLLPTQDASVVASAATDLTDSINRGDDVMEAFTAYAAEVGNSTNQGLVLLQSLVSLLLTAVFLLILLSLAKGERTDVSFSAAARPVMTYVKYVGVSILKVFFVGVATCCCILPGIWLGVRLSLADAYVLDRDDMGIWDAIKASWRATSGHFWGLLGLAIVAGLIAVLGLLACCIGYYFTCVIAAFAYVIVYLILSGHYAKGSEDTEAAGAEVL